MNRAAAQAGDWDTALVIDADVLPDAGKVREAVDRTTSENRIVLPFDVRHNVGPRGTQSILHGNHGSWRKFVARTFYDQNSSVFAISRRLWDAVGGFDEGFSGWGFEDNAFAMACEVFGDGRQVNLKGEVWHLHHAAAPDQKHGTPSHARNMARKQQWERAWQAGDKERMRQLTAEGRDLEQNRTVLDHIPQILHRVVPANTPDEAEVWWQDWGRLHPGWRLMTWRDPLDPADFPITSKHWPDKPGAQLADLVRLEVLHRYGGVYVDMDMQPFRNLEPLCVLEAFAAWEDAKVVPNAVIGARPEHEAIRLCLDECIRNQRRGIWAAGPGVTTRVMPNRADVLLLPPGTFYAVHYNDPDRDTLMRQPPGPWEYARHHYWGSWLPEERRRVPA